MQISIQSNPMYDELLGDRELAGVLDAPSEVRAMIDVELALANAQSVIGMIPRTAGAELTAALAHAAPDTDAIARGVSGAGVPVPALLAELREVLEPELSRWLHWGATSQDIVDTASMLQIAECLVVLEGRLSRLLDSLHEQSNAHATTLMAARTRTQLATPVTLGLRIARWAQPLIGLEKELRTLKPQVLKVQLGGAVGANTVLAPHGPAIVERMARALKLSSSPSWHTDRSGILRLADWLLRICLSTGKMAKDLTIMSRSDIAEVSAGRSGGSSTMPHKANPVRSEMVVAMSTIAQALHGGLRAAGSPAEERDGASWSVEWVLLPQLLITAGCALRHGASLADTLVADRHRLQATVTGNSALMAEAASFALAAHLPRHEATALVREALASAEPLGRALADGGGLDLDWEAILDPRTVCAPCRQAVDGIFAERIR